MAISDIEDDVMEVGFKKEEVLEIARAGYLNSCLMSNKLGDFQAAYFEANAVSSTLGNLCRLLIFSLTARRCMTRPFSARR